MRFDFLYIHLSAQDNAIDHRQQGSSIKTSSTGEIFLATVIQKRPSNMANTRVFACSMGCFCRNCVRIDFVGACPQVLKCGSWAYFHVGF